MGGGIVDWVAIMPQVARQLLGEPNRRLSRAGRELRYGAKGSLSVDLRKAVWCDFEGGSAGGVLDLVRREHGGSRTDAVRWLREHGHLDSQGRPRVRVNGYHNPAERTAPPERTYPTAPPEKSSQGERERAESAARRAKTVFDHASYATHPYLARKGFPEHRGFVIGGERLVVPVRGERGTGDVVGLQTILPDGTKRFGPPGCRVKGGGFRLGGGGEGTWYVEGYATALSVRAALRLLYRPQDAVVIAFSAGNLPQVAGRRGIVIGDRDPKGAGERAARATGLPYWLPREGDANDFHRAHGVQALADRLRTLIRQAQGF